MTLPMMFALGWIGGTFFAYLVMLAIHMRMKPKCCRCGNPHCDGKGNYKP